MMTVLDLFSGIGGFSLGLERTGGFKTVQFCEIDPYCQKVLAKNFPGVPIHDDIRTLKPSYADIVVGGFPCQDISNAGLRVGLGGARSGLWTQLARIIGEIRPRYAIVENVAALLNRGMGTVLSDLAAIGFDAQWHCIPASAVGALHRRDRIWIVAYPHGERCSEPQIFGEQSRRTEAIGASEVMAHASSDRMEKQRVSAEKRQLVGNASGRGGRGETSNAGCELLEGWQPARATDRSEIPNNAQWWEFEPDVGRVAHGVPNRVDRLKGLGNAVVPQVVQAIGYEILNAEAR